MRCFAIFWFYLPGEPDSQSFEDPASPETRLESCLLLSLEDPSCLCFGLTDWDLLDFRIIPRHCPYFNGKFTLERYVQREILALQCSRPEVLKSGLCPLGISSMSDPELTTGWKLFS